MLNTLNNITENDLDFDEAIIADLDFNPKVDSFGGDFIEMLENFDGETLEATDNIAQTPNTKKPS